MVDDEVVVVVEGSLERTKALVFEMANLLSRISGQEGRKGKRELYFAIRKTLGTRRCPLEGAIVDEMQRWVR